MRHNHGYRKFDRTSEHRRAMFRNLATSLILHERINTTLAKAKDLRRIVEKLVTKGKRGDLHARRLVNSYLLNKTATQKLFSDIAKRFKTRGGGYTRILKRGIRLSDSARLASIEFVDYNFAKTEKSKENKENKKA